MDIENKNDAPTVIVEKTIPNSKEANLDESTNKIIHNKTSNITFIDSLLGKSSYQLGKELILKPDLIINENHYYFFPEKTKSDLEEELKKDLDSYPYMFKPIKEELLKFSKEKQTKEFKINIGFFTSLFRKIYFLFNKKEENEDICEKAIKVAQLISQLNQATEKSKKIVIFKANEAKFDVDDNYFDKSPIIQSIDQDLNVNTKLINTIDDNYINLLYEKMNEFKNMIFNNCQNNNGNENEIIVLINYLIIRVNKILIDIENSYETK